MAVQIAILGSVEPRMNGAVVAVPTGKQRVLLTLLAVRVPHAASAESAAEALWPRAAPAQAMRSLQVTVSRLRRSLGDAASALETVASGYADAAHWIEQALSLPGADSHPGLCVRALCMRATALWPLGRGDELDAAIAEAESIARQLGDPVILSQTLQLRVDHETGASGSGRLDVADALADEALQCARAADDAWEIAEALRVKARVVSSIGRLRERTDRAAAQREAVGNMHQLVNLLISAPYGALCLGSDRDAKELLDRALPVAHDLGDPFKWAIVCGNLGLAALLTGDTDRALHAFRDELRLCREHVVLPMACEGLLGLAAIAAAGADDERAARLAGAAAAHRYGTPEDSVEIRLDEAFLEPARQRCGADVWAASAHEGVALSFEDAISDALQEQPMSGAALAPHRLAS